LARGGIYLPLGCTILLKVREKERHSFGGATESAGALIWYEIYIEDYERPTHISVCFKINKESIVFKDSNWISITCDLIT